MIDFDRILTLCRRPAGKYLDCDQGIPDAERFDFIVRWLLPGWLILWTLLPGLCIGNAFIDVSENVAWGQNFQFGYDKNPYFGAWLTYYAFQLWPSAWVSYLLSQLSVVMALAAMYALGKRIFAQKFHAFVALLLLLMIPYYSHSAVEFNDDVIEIGLWAVLILYFHRALAQQRLGDWAMVGLSAGLAFMTKYLGAALFLVMLVLLLSSAQGRRSWRKPGVYLAGLIVLALSLPNLIWLWENDFIAFRYALQRARLEGDVPTLADHFIRPLNMIGEFVLRLLLPMAALAVIFKRGKTALTRREDTLFLTLLTFGPLMLSFLFAAVTGGKVISSWTTPYYNVTGLFLVMVFRPVAARSNLRWLERLLVAWVAVGILLFGYEYLYKRPYLRDKCSYNCFPGQAVAERATAEWRKRYGSPLPYVIGNRENACNITFYSSDHPTAFFKNSVELSQWIAPEDVARRGGVLVWVYRQPGGWLKAFEGKMEVIEPLPFERATPGWLRKIAGEPRKIWLSIGILPPRNDAAAR